MMATHILIRQVSISSFTLYAIAEYPFTVGSLAGVSAGLY